MAVHPATPSTIQPIALLWFSKSDNINCFVPTDETVRILLMSDKSSSAWEANMDVTFNVAVVLVVSLLSIALIITGNHNFQVMSFL